MDTTAFYSATAHIDANEIISYHEAGHAVMAHVFGRLVDDIMYELNVIGTYNGRTHWGGAIRIWDAHVPYDELGTFGLEKEKESDNGEALIIAAGKAAERLLYRQRGLDETNVNYGPRSGYDDESELEEAIGEWYRKKVEQKEMYRRVELEERHLKPEQVVQAKRLIEELAMKLLGVKQCWMVVEVVAQASLKALSQEPEKFVFDDVHEVMEKAFAKVLLSEKT